MTTEEKRKELGDFCDTHIGDCENCLFCETLDWCSNYNENNAPDEVIDEAYNKLHPPGECVGVIPSEPVYDVVSHPKHYCREGAIECIDEMVILFGKEAVKHFCLCNAWKYRYRSNEKNGDEDIKKSDWYINKYKELSNGF